MDLCVTATNVLINFEIIKYIFSENSVFYFVALHR